MDVSDGLEGVVAAETVLSDVDGAAGRLTIRGHSLDEIAGRWTFEDAAALLWSGFFQALPGDFRAALGSARVEVAAEIEALDDALACHPPIEVMRALTARLADGDELATALRLTAAPAVFTAAALRTRAGQRPVPPDPSISHAADILRLCRGGVGAFLPVRAQA